MTTPTIVSQYSLYDIVRFTATFVSTDLVTPADASAITLYVRSPAGSIATYPFGVAGASVVRDGVGRYWREITLDMDGRWDYFWRGTGGVQANEEYQIHVGKSQIFNL